MLTHFFEEHGKSGCREGRRHSSHKGSHHGSHKGGHHGSHKGEHHGGHKEGHGCDSKHYHLRPEYQKIWDCLTYCIPTPIKNSCLIPRDHIHKMIGEMMH